jgi:hypothetical protein
MRFRRRTHCQTADIAECPSAPRFRVLIELHDVRLERLLCELHTDRAVNGALTLGLSPQVFDARLGVDVACVDVLSDEAAERLREGEREA